MSAVSSHPGYRDLQLRKPIYLAGIVIPPSSLIGGMDSIGGALVGGIVVGVCEALVGAYIEPRGLIGFKEVAPYILLLIVLIVRPYGLFGTVRIERVTMLAVEAPGHLSRRFRANGSRSP
jgi:hypothetical protein